MNLPLLPAHQFNTVLSVGFTSAAFTWLLTLCAEMAGSPMNWVDHLGLSVFVGGVAYIGATLFLTWRNRQIS